ncbi:MAG: DUF2760 domain-containing protein [Planctomycetia bacterium]|nr:DUF2760 domain-containing protein [Planctomycetia bacterium]
MGRLAIALKSFFRALGNQEFAGRVALLLDGSASPQPAKAAPENVPAAAPSPVKAAAPAKPKPTRNDALSLLFALQREARLVDFLKESISAYDDAQIGAAVRDVHRDCAAAIERIFALRPATEQAEGSPLEVAEGFDAARFRLTGNVVGKPPFRGMVAHHGWQATRCELPAWTGSEAAQTIVAPIELEIK